MWKKLHWRMWWQNGKLFFLPFILGENQTIGWRGIIFFGKKFTNVKIDKNRRKNVQKLQILFKSDEANGKLWSANWHAFRWWPCPDSGKRPFACSHYLPCHYLIATKTLFFLFSFVCCFCGNGHQNANVRRMAIGHHPSPYQFSISNFAFIAARMGREKEQRETRRKIVNQRK